MRVHALLYHDIVGIDDDASGFPGLSAARYKLTEEDFAAHMAALGAAQLPPCITAPEIRESDSGTRLMVTVDDGGSSALHLADSIESLGWRGHFFITTSRIDTPGFLTRREIRALHERGHIIGTHSHTHPYRISELPAGELEREWSTSTETLAEIIAAKVECASVPGGFFAPRVAAAAARAGVRVLFTSEPTTRMTRMHDCLIVGRFTIYRGMSPDAAADFARGAPMALVKQAAMWNVKKAVKTLAAPVWEAVRRLAFRQS